MSWAIWITGLPGQRQVCHRAGRVGGVAFFGVDVVVLELDAIRKVLTPKSTYSDAEREAVYRALVYTGATLVDAGTPVIFDATAHRRAWRDLARAALPAFAEIQLLCPLEICRQREAGRPQGAAPPGIYGRATSPGARVPGVNVEYELARSPELPHRYDIEQHRGRRGDHRHLRPGSLPGHIELVVEQAGARPPRAARNRIRRAGGHQPACARFCGKLAAIRQTRGASADEGGPRGARAHGRAPDCGSRCARRDRPRRHAEGPARAFRAAGLEVVRL